MSEEKARQILGRAIDKYEGLSSPSSHLEWEIGKSFVSIDGYFTADELEAIAWWMRNK